MSKKALVLLYPKNEENEIVIPITVLRKANYDITIAGPTMEPVIGSWKTKMLPETTLKEAMKKGPYDVIVVGGGQFGWESLSADKDVGTVLRQQEESGRLIAAICTAPIAMKNHKIMYGRKLTSFPWVENMVREGDHYIYKHANVVKDGNLITSRGNYTSFHFALAIVEYLSGRPAAEEAAKEMLIDY